MLSLSYEGIDQIIKAYSHNPHSILGIHKITAEDGESVVVRVFDPYAKKVWVKKGSKFCEMSGYNSTGFFELIFPHEAKKFDYYLKFQYHDGRENITKDPYSFEPVITDFDMHLFSQGNCEDIYRKLGAKIMTLNGTKGTLFSVWAPEVKRVSVVGDFNQWDGRRHQMRAIKDSGIWEIFIPGLAENEKYKFEILSGNNQLFLKSDPYGYFMEMRPQTASIVWDIDKYQWNDEKWIAEREKKNWFKSPISIYEVHLGSWMRKGDGENDFLTYRQLAEKLAAYVKEMGYTFIELMPVQEHPFDGSWGYQVTGYYASTSRFGTPDDFKYFVDYMHQNGIGVIMDWVPGHFPKDACGLANFNGNCLYEYSDPRKGEHLEWGTKVFDYGRNQVRNFLLSNAVFWVQEYHIDGFRVDAVASILYLNYCRKDGEWVPNQYGGNENIEGIFFLRRLNEIIHGRFPGVMVIAEESTSWAGVSKPTYTGGLGFTFKWNMGWMNDFLKYMSLDPIFRRYKHNNITFAMLYNSTENFILVLSHDEVVHGKKHFVDKMPGWDWDKFASARVALGFMYGHPGKKLLFQGIDFGMWNEWWEAREIDWYLLNYEPHHKLNRFLKDLNHLYKNNPLFYEGDHEEFGFQWVDCADWESSIVSFMRRDSQGNYFIFAFNFTPVVRLDYRIGVPENRFYKEILNSDSYLYWGANLGNNGGVHAQEYQWQGQPYSIDILVPPLSCIVFKPE